MSPRAARYAVSAVFFVNGAALGGWVTHLADVETRLQISHHTLGAALLSSGLGAVTTMPLGGILINRFGSRVTSIVGGFLLLCVIPWLLRCPSLWLFVPTLYMVGVTNGQMDVGMNAHSMAIQERFPKPIISAIHGWFSVGGFVGGVGATIAASLKMSPEDHLLIASCILAVILCGAAPFLLGRDVDRGGEGAAFALPKGLLLVLGLLVMSAFVGEGCIWDWAAVYLRSSLGTSPVVGSLGFAIPAFSMCVARFVGDHLIHRFGEAKVLLVSSALGVLGVFTAINVSSVPAIIAGFTVAGFGLANTVPILFKAASKAPGVSSGAGLAAVTTLGYAGLLGGPPIIGMIADYRSLSFALGIGAVLCGMIGIFGPKAIRQMDAADKPYSEAK